MTTLSERDITDRATTRDPIEPVANSVSCYWRNLDRSDDSLLDFDHDRLHGVAEAQALLRLEPVIYRNHLAIAKFLDGWIDRIWQDAVIGEAEFSYVQALLEVAAGLRAGDFTDACCASTQ